MLAWAIAWSLIAASLPAFAQSLELNAAYRQYESLDALGKYAEAEAFARKALELGEAEFGADHPTYAIFLNHLAELYYYQGRYGKAEPLFKRSQAILEKTLGPDHPSVATSLNNLATLYQANGRHALALEHIRRASEIHRHRAARTGGARSAGGQSEQRKVRSVFLRHLQAIIEIPTNDPLARDTLTAEGFLAGQLANATGARAAVSRMVARFAAGGWPISAGLFH